MGQNIDGDRQPSWGRDVEEHARRLAADLGVPDFVYQSSLERKGTALREVSDGLLSCGQDGVILQVKSREPGAARGDTPNDAGAWLRKAAKVALGQANGTRRRLANPRPLKFTSLRGYERELNGIEDWPAVVILQHPSTPPDIVLDPAPRTLWITCADWLGLHERLRSTAAVIAYVGRAIASGINPPVGRELDRYDRLALADALAAGGPDSLPMLPLASLRGDDLVAAAFVSDLIEKVWPQDGIVPWTDPDDYRRIVEVLDRIPPMGRARLGRKMIDTFLKAREAGDRRSFLMYDESQDARIAMVYDVVRSDMPPEGLLPEIAALGVVRQHQALEQGANGESKTLSIGVLHDEDRGRMYSFAYVGTPPPSIPGSVRWDIESRYGVFDGVTISARPQPRRNERCPCLSGKKYKHCCGRFGSR